MRFLFYSVKLGIKSDVVVTAYTKRHFCLQKENLWCWRMC